MDDIWESIDCVEDITDRPAPFSFIFLVNVGKGERKNYKKIKNKDNRTILRAVENGQINDLAHQRN